MNTENIRAAWVEQLWKRKGYDSPEEFIECGTCFACGLDSGELKTRETQKSNVTTVDDVHLLCRYCHSACKGLAGLSYWRWFLNRKAADTMAAAMLQRLARL